jgi:hypothetical protein
LVWKGKQFAAGLGIPNRDTSGIRHGSEAIAVRAKHQWRGSLRGRLETAKQAPGIRIVQGEWILVIA